MEKHGITTWKFDSDYHKRSLGETAMYRFKTIFGSTITARTLKRQKTQLRIHFNTMDELTLLGILKLLPLPKGTD